MPSRSRFRTEKAFMEAVRSRLLTACSALGLPIALFKVHGGPYQAGGIADLVGCIAGVFVALEFKRSGGKLTPRQQATLESIARAGGVAVVVSPDGLVFAQTSDPPPLPIRDAISAAYQAATVRGGD